MIVGDGNFRYKWIENWVKIPNTQSGRENGRTHGVVVSKDGSIIIFNQADPGVLVYNQQGKLVNSWGSNFMGAHGMTLVTEQGKEYLWLTDQYSGDVIKTTLNGEVRNTITKPNLLLFNNEKYSPTWVAVFEEDRGGNGDIWVSDGYGESLVHRYNKKGVHTLSLTGEGAGRFNCPHSLFFDYRKNEPELYIADRGNKRFCIYDSEGIYKRSFGENILDCPCGGVVKDGILYVPELCARLAVLDKDDKLIMYLGQNEPVRSLPGWPNHEKELIQKGKFNSPHHLAVDNDGNIYVVEWIIGGRITKLEKII